MAAKFSRQVHGHLSHTSAAHLDLYITSERVANGQMADQRLPRHAFGSTGVQCSVVGLGCSPFGHAYGVSGLQMLTTAFKLPANIAGSHPSRCCLVLQSPNEDQAIAAVHLAIKKYGLNFFDVAPFYAGGDAERVRVKRCIAASWQHLSCSAAPCGGFLPVAQHSTRHCFAKSTPLCSVFLCCASGKSTQEMYVLLSICHSWQSIALRSTRQQPVDVCCSSWGGRSRGCRERTSLSAPRWASMCQGSQRTSAQTGGAPPPSAAPKQCQEACVVNIAPICAPAPALPTCTPICAPAPAPPDLNYGPETVTKA